MTTTTRYPTGTLEADCLWCSGTGNRRTLTQGLAECNECCGTGVVATTRPLRSVSPDAASTWDGTDRRTHDPRKIVVTLPDGSQLSVGRWADDDSPDVMIRASVHDTWVPASMADLDVQDREQ